MYQQLIADDLDMVQMHCMHHVKAFTDQPVAVIDFHTDSLVAWSSESFPPKAERQ